jgi:lysophospholipase L1-like esterase
VVVNLGTNDFFTDVPDHARFVVGYRSLLARVRSRHPDALLVLAIGPMLADDFPQPDARKLVREWLTEVRDAMRSEGDERVDLFEVWFDPDEGVGCDQHPNVITHARLGRELAELVRARLSW